MRTQFGERLRAKRLDQSLGLRQFAKSIGMDPSNYSRIERGDVTPTEAVLGRMAEALKISPASDEWELFMFSADVNRHQIPDEVAQRRDLAANLPAFFARLKKEAEHATPTSEEMYELYKSVITRSQSKGA